MSSSWPSLPYDSWQPTRDTLHRYCQIVGKVRMALVPRRNHWWHVTLYVTPRGLTTGSMPVAKGCAAIHLDFLDHHLTIDCSSGGKVSFPLRDGLSVADFHRQLMEALDQLGIEVVIIPKPFDLPDSTPFAEDDTHASYDRHAVRHFQEALLVANTALMQMTTDYVGKASPVQFFWHSFDLAYTRFSGRRAPGTGDADQVTAEAYSHEVVSFGWWPGDPVRPYPAFYAYISPEPDTLSDMQLSPSYARLEGEEGASLAVLDWEEVRQERDPARAVDGFLREFFDGATRLARWPVDNLVR